MKRNENYVLRTVGDIGVLVPTNAASGQALVLARLTPTATYIWQLLANDLTFGELSEAVASRYRVVAPAIDADIHHFIDVAINAGIVVS